MAALEDENGNAIVENVDLIQLLNTNTITELKREPKKGPAVLIGGIDYDFDPKGASTENVDSIITNNVWEFLPGTLQEVKSIAKIYQSADADFIIKSGEKANEEWFRTICKNGGPSVLHMATHGFSFSEEEAWEIAATGSQNDYHIPNLGTEPLERTGLLLAHANFAWANYFNDLEPEDGILTADEIEKLDLQNTDLVVLSACETGLGEIKGTEGVLGLQRAFRLAGAKYMILSLWQVPDKETSEFMVLFYKHWFDGDLIHQAFNKTQREMSAKYKSEPEKWAAFVLVE
jgi:CHAT domain-containing protein